MTRSSDAVLGSVVAGLVALASLSVLVVAGSSPLDRREAAGVFPPWWSSAQVFEASARAGSVRSLGGVPFIVVVHDPSGQAPERLQRAGALFSVSPQGGLICGS